MAEILRQHEIMPIVASDYRQSLLVLVCHQTNINRNIYWKKMWQTVHTTEKRDRKTAQIMTF